MDFMNYKVLDLFCGCGGLSEGFRLAGFDIMGGIDFNQSAIDTYKYNFKDATAICADLSKFSDDDISYHYPDLHKLDIIIGGPPCQGFSNANRYRSEDEDPRNRLFFEFVKFVDRANPKVVLIENVRGIITNNKGYAKDRIYEIFEKRGYKVTHRILDASKFGVPQRRLRNFFVMSKTKHVFDFNQLIEKKEIVTVKEAVGELYNYDTEGEIITLKQNPSTEYQKYLRREDNKVFNHDARYPAEFVQKRISFVPQGGNWREVPEELWPSKRNNRHSSAYKRLKEDDVSCTIDTGNNHSNYFHPLYNRIPTVREAARLQSFNDSFVFLGNRSEQYRQVGNAVPPLLAKAIAKEIKEILDEEE